MAQRKGSTILIDHVCQTFKMKDRDVVALDRASFEVQAGEFVSLLGPSGCGKSTLLLACAGLGPYDSGRIAINGATVVGPQTEIGIVFQDAFLLEWRTVLQNVMLQAELRRLDLDLYRSRALQLLERVGLGQFAKAMPHELSGGMRQRAAICRALLHDPALLFMDEPFGALDALTRDDLNLELQDIWIKSPKTVLFVTHSIAEAVLLSDRIVVMSARPGRIVEILPIDLPRPRDLALRETPEFARYTRHIRSLFASLGVIRGDATSSSESQTI